MLLDYFHLTRMCVCVCVGGGGGGGGTQCFVRAAQKQVAAVISAYKD